MRWATVWSQWTWTEKRGLLYLFLGELYVTAVHNVAWDEAYLHAKFHLDTIPALKNAQNGVV